MSYTMNWNAMRTNITIPNAFIVGFLLYNVAHNIYHETYRNAWFSGKYVIGK